MKGKKVIGLNVYEVDGEAGEYQTEIAIMCSPVTLIAGMSEAIYKVNESLNNTGNLPKNFFWTLICETVSDRMIEETEER